MNNKGFTLVELVAVIALLAIIAIISFVSINEVLERSKVSDCESLVRNIKSATKEYVSDNRYNFTSNSSFDITANTLISGNYLSSPITNPFTKEEIDANDIIIKIELNNDYSTKNVVVKNKDDSVIDCDSNQW